MNDCKDCIRTVQTKYGELNVDICKMLGTCVCDHEKIVLKTTTEKNIKRTYSTPGLVV